MSDNETPEPRKATDILLAVEAKLDQLLHLSRSQDLNIKILSNKLTALTTEFHAAMADDGTAPPANAEKTASPFIGDTSIPQVEYKLPMTAAPNGFRRTSRPETFIKEPIQVKPGTSPVPQQAQAQPAELLWNPNKPKAPATKPAPPPPAPAPASPPAPKSAENVAKTPVIQRVLDNNGKSIFNANVEIINTQLNQIVFSNRTSSTGAWQAQLEPGTYKVNVKRQESISKTKINMSMEFSVAASGVLLKLPDMVAK